MSVIVTGGARGIGRATLELLLARGESVVALDRDVEPLLEIDSEQLTLVAGDVTDHDVIAKACDLAGEVTGLVTCAGISRPMPSSEVTVEGWRELLTINLEATFFTMRAVAETARPGSSLVAISSISGAQGFAGRAAYSASKAGVEGLVRSLAVEYAPSLRVNAISPGYVMTDLVRANLANGIIDESGILSRTPLGRWGEPDDIARAIAFLLSDESSWITGTTITVDGGWLAHGLGADA